VEMSFSLTRTCNGGGSTKWNTAGSGSTIPTRASGGEMAVAPSRTRAIGTCKNTQQQAKRYHAQIIR
jgi:hypothetical protein